MTCQTSLFLGVYVLGAGDATERLLVETHLPDCAECRAELGRLAPLPGPLARLPAGLLAADGTAAGAASPGSPRRARAKLRSVRPRWAVALTAAAAAALGLASGLVLAPAGTSQAPMAVTLSGVNRVTQVHATAALTATSWGTSIRLRASGLPENVLCRLIIHSRSGRADLHHRGPRHAGPRVAAQQRGRPHYRHLLSVLLPAPGTALAVMTLP